MLARQHITERLPPARPTAAPEKPARAVASWEAEVASSKVAQPVGVRTAGSATGERYVQSPEARELMIEVLVGLRKERTT